MLKIWHVKNHSKSKKAYKEIDKLCGAPQDFSEFGVGEKLCIALKNLNPAFAARVDQVMKNIAIADLSQDTEAKKAFEADQKEFGSGGTIWNEVRKLL